MCDLIPSLDTRPVNPGKLSLLGLHGGQELLLVLGKHGVVCKYTCGDALSR